MKLRLPTIKYHYLTIGTIPRKDGKHFQITLDGKLYGKVYKDWKL